MGGQTCYNSKRIMRKLECKLASRKEILDFIKGKPASFDKWVPTSDSNNSWLEVVIESRSGLTPDYGLLHQIYPMLLIILNYSADGKTQGEHQGGIQPIEKVYTAPKLMLVHQNAKEMILVK